VPDKLKFNETIKRVLDRLVGDLIRNTQSRLDAAKIRSLEDVRHYPERLVALSPDVEEERRTTKSFLYENLYFSPALAEEKDDAEIVITTLFDQWMEKPVTLPHNYQDKAREEPLPRLYRGNDRPLHL
jgi:dGTPase